MFGIIADLLTSITSILFPVFASYKAIRSSDPAHILPWLMYWTTLSLFLAVESFFYPILSWVPFYAWIRLCVHLYLVLPGKQGSVFLYQSYIHPFLEEHEREIDHFITDSHDKAKKAGLQYIQQAIEYIKVNVLGMPPRPATPPASRNVSYSQALLGKFTMPSARQGLAAMGSADIFSMLGSAVQQATYPSSRSREAQAEDLTASGNLIPPNMSGEERSRYIATQREHLKTLLRAFDKEAYEAEPGGAMSREPPETPERPMSSGNSPGGLTKSKSEAEFVNLTHEAVSGAPKPAQQAQGVVGGIGKWIWGNHSEKDSALPAKKQQ